MSALSSTRQGERGVMTAGLSPPAIGVPRSTLPKTLRPSSSREGDSLSADLWHPTRSPGLLLEMVQKEPLSASHPEGLLYLVDC